jgi:hydrogenase nickel insertion protein HypA
VHEYSIVQSLIERVEEEARSRGAVSILRVSVRIGELSGVETELLETAYATFREVTVCREADLLVHAVPARWACRLCGRAIGRGEILSCPDCGSPARLVEGDEILLERIEMEVP